MLQASAPSRALTRKKSRVSCTYGFPALLFVYNQIVRMPSQTWIEHRNTRTAEPNKAQRTLVLSHRCRFACENSYTELLEGGREHRFALLLPSLFETTTEHSISLSRVLKSRRNRAV